MTIRHVVLWKLAADDAQTRDAQAAELVRRLHALVGVVPSIRALSAGVNAAYPDGNSDVALVVDVDDLQGLEDYQVHPAHQELVGFVRSIVSGRMAVDFEV
ncbi:Dabb family protein [Microbacterium sp.]|uniref:Dabb family protein n=1 Tax=Microbacterium sp. TaxID=51671 RepID=UPI0039E26CC6